MKRRTLWIIGVTTAIVTVTGLNVALGSRYRMHDRYHHHWCMQAKDGENKTTPSTDVKSDTTNGR